MLDRTAKFGHNRTYEARYIFEGIWMQTETPRLNAAQSHSLASAGRR
jgi:hypothetical protein